MIRRIAYCLLPALLVLVTGCSHFIQEPKVTLKQSSIINLDTAGADLEFYLGITNPNSFDLSVLSYTYDLRVMTLNLANSGLQETLSIPSESETDMRLPVRIRYSDLFEIIKRHPDPEKIPYQLNARLHVRTTFGDKIIPIEKNSTFAIPEKYRPDFYLERFKDIFKRMP
ncbi:MAG TPA: LEA type 2 family protein [Desulfuromonadaceae bacterium]|jgi:LEA14-like dessication related protein